MKNNTLVIIAAVLFCTLAASCGKKSDSDMKTDSSAMPKTAMNMAMSNVASNITVSLAPDRIAGSIKGVKVTSTDTNIKSATFTVNNSASPQNGTFQYRAFYGSNNQATSSDSSGSTSGSGTRQWAESKIDLMPVFWYPQFRTAGSVAWMNYDGDSISTVLPSTAYFMSSTQPSANITVGIIGGGGGPK